MFVRAALNILSPAHVRARLAILIFHRVLPVPDPLQPGEMHAQQFDEICGWLKEWFNVLPLDVAVNQLRYCALPSRACAITFDDGYADNLHIATPILKKHGLCATFFIASGFLNGGRMWNDTVIESVRSSPLQRFSVAGLGDYGLENIEVRRQTINTLINEIKYMAVAERQAMTEEIAKQAFVVPPDNLMMVTDDLRRMRDHGMQIGAHTISHPILATLPDEDAVREIKENQKYLQDVISERVGIFAYPNGKYGQDYLRQHVNIVRELGFDAAVTTNWGASDVAADIFQLRRFTPWDATKGKFGARLIRNLMTNKNKYL